MAAFSLLLLTAPYCVLIQVRFGIVEFLSLLDHCAEHVGSRCVHPDAALARALGVELDNLVFWDQLAQSVLLEIAKFATPAIAIGLWRVLKCSDHNERICVVAPETASNSSSFAGDVLDIHPVPAPISLEPASEDSSSDEQESIPSRMPQNGKVPEVRHRTIATLDAPILPPSRVERRSAHCQIRKIYARAMHPWIRGPPHPL